MPCRDLYLIIFSLSVCLATFLYDCTIRTPTSTCRFDRLWFGSRETCSRLCSSFLWTFLCGNGQGFSGTAMSFGCVHPKSVQHCGCQAYISLTTQERRAVEYETPLQLVSVVWYDKGGLHCRSPPHYVIHFPSDIVLSTHCCQRNPRTYSPIAPCHTTVVGSQAATHNLVALVTPQTTPSPCSLILVTAVLATYKHHHTVCACAPCAHFRTASCSYTERWHEFCGTVRGVSTF